MKYTGFLALLLLTGCVLPNTKEADCRQQAEDRYSLYNKQGTSPASVQERQNVLDTLYNQCMRNNTGYQKEADSRNAKEDDTESAAPNPPPVSVSMWGQPPAEPALQEKTQEKNVQQEKVQASGAAVQSPDSVVAEPATTAPTASVSDTSVQPHVLVAESPVSASRASASPVLAQASTPSNVQSSGMPQLKVSPDAELENIISRQ